MCRIEGWSGWNSEVEGISRLNKSSRQVSEKQVRFEDFVLQFDTSSRGGFRARVLKSPFGEGAVGFSLPPLAGAAALAPSGISLGVSRDLSRDLVVSSAALPFAGQPPLEIGMELYRSVLQGQVRQFRGL